MAKKRKLIVQCKRIVRGKIVRKMPHKVVGRDCMALLKPGQVEVYDEVVFELKKGMK